jgi:hypothetical protein
MKKKNAKNSIGSARIGYAIEAPKACVMKKKVRASTEERAREDFTASLMKSSGFFLM